MAPFHFTDLTGKDVDPGHGWASIHAEWDNGMMDGFYTSGGLDALGYYDSADLPYYYSLLPQSALCANYFCGILLSENGITFRNYNFNCPDNYSILALFKNWAAGGPDNELNTPQAQFFTDCQNNTLPQVSFITEAPPYDEHPPSRTPPVWASTAILITYDEAGGYFDHIAPPQLDAYGPGIRVPMLIVSPFAKPGFVDRTFSDHSSVLKFIESVFGLPTLASINHEFDTSTPTAGNDANGAPFPPCSRMYKVLGLRCQEHSARGRAEIPIMEQSAEPEQFASPGNFARGQYRGMDLAGLNRR